MSRFSSRRRLVAVTVALAAFSILAVVAVAAHWPQQGGDPGHSGYQPLAPTDLPVGEGAGNRWFKADENIRTSITATLGSDSVTQRIVYGADNGTVHNQRLTQLGQTVGPESGFNVDSAPIDDTDTFGNGDETATIFDASSSPRGNLVVLHNDDNQQYGGNDPRQGSDIAIATLRVLQLANGQETIVAGTDEPLGINKCPSPSGPNQTEPNCANFPNTIHFQLNAPGVMGPMDSSGQRQIFFVAQRPEARNSHPPASDSLPCQPEPSPSTVSTEGFETPPQSGNEADRACRVPSASRLFSVAISEDPANGDISVVPGSLRMSSNITELNTFAAPTLAFLDPEADGDPKLYVLATVRDTSTGGTGTQDGRVFGYPADSNLRTGQITSPLLGEAAWSPSVPTTPQGTMPNPAPYMFVAVEEANDNFSDPDDLIGSDPDDVKVVKLGPDLKVIAESPFVGGNPSPSLATSRTVNANGTGGAGGRVVMATNQGLYSFNSEALSAYTANGPTGKSFSRTVPALSGKLAYIAANDGDQFVFDAATLDEAPNDASGFRENEANTGAASSFGQPAISNRWVVFGSNLGSFAYRAAELQPAPGTTFPTYAVSDVTQAEGNSGVTMFNFTITRFGPITSAGSVRARTVDGTAKAGSDFSPLNQTINFPPGTRDVTVGISVFGDNDDENDETFFLDIDQPGPAGATVLDPRGNGTIVSEDPRRTAPGPATPLIQVNDVVAEEGGNAVFQVTMSNTSSNTVTVDFATADNTARAGSDYGGGRGTLTFTPGQVVKTISVPIVRDSSVEDIERFFLNLSNAKNAGISDGQGVAFIVARLYELPKVNPRSISASTKPRRDTKKPYRFTTTGTLRLPSGMSRSQGCSGRVTIVFKAGRKTISTRRASISRSRCTYRSTVTFKNSKRFTKSGVLTVRARYGGNDRLRAKSARSHKVRTK